MESVNTVAELLEKNQRLQPWRYFKDSFARHSIAIGGVSVIAAVLLIFFYLFSVVLPLFTPASVKPLAQYAPPASGKALRYHSEEQAEIGTRVGERGEVSFFALSDGAQLAAQQLNLPAGTTITSYTDGTIGTDTLAIGLSNGTAVIAALDFDLTYPEGKRVITPSVSYPLGEEPLVFDPQGAAIERIAMGNADDETTVAAALADGRVVIKKLRVRKSLMGDANVSSETLTLDGGRPKPLFMMISGDQRWLITIDQEDFINLVSLVGEGAPKVVDRKRVTPDGDHVTAMARLIGGISAIIGTEKGRLEQWFPVRDPQNRYTIERVRTFRTEGPAIRVIEPEHRRKGFLVGDDAGDLGIYLATASREVYRGKVADQAPAQLAIAPRSNRFITELADGRLSILDVHNEHPEVSWSSLWGKVWYEGYAEPKYLWQSSAANDDFEPKFSLSPLTFGTLKAAFYAMLVSMPLAILGAIFTAYFMAPAMRQVIKPTIEIMEALPTVVLGFLAGLWLAPFMENHLPGMFALLLLVPLAVVLASWVWFHVPRAVRALIPDGWEGALLIPVLLVAGWISIQLSVPLENALFGGDVRVWLRDHGIGYDQRNALVVGFAMGFAVIPTIFAIAEDAIFSVPRHLVNGSLALGATTWQTLVGVVLPTASPAIFSAVTIGFGRAVGETMIVLMATGNTPVMEWNIFEGMRTLAANIAVEMPESEVGGTHYRVLFLAALVLLTFTFLLNTVAELVRHRLRKKYSSL